MGCDWIYRPVARESSFVIERKEKSGHNRSGLQRVSLAPSTVSVQVSLTEHTLATALRSNRTKRVETVPAYVSRTCVKHSRGEKEMRTTCQDSCPRQSGLILLIQSRTLRAKKAPGSSTPRATASASQRRPARPSGRTQRRISP